MDEQLDSVVNETVRINGNILDALGEIEVRYPEVLEYIYSEKIFDELNFAFLETEKKIEELQLEIFGSQVNIEDKVGADPALRVLIENILDEKFNLYELARKRISFDEPASIRVTDFLKKNLRATFTQNGRTIFEPPIRSFATYWPEVNFDSKSRDNINPKNLEFDKNIDLEFSTRLEFITIMLETVRLYNLQNEDDNHIINQDSYSISFKDVPSGIYRIVIKTAYEPSDDQRAWFEDLIRI